MAGRLSPELLAKLQKTTLSLAPGSEFSGADLPSLIDIVESNQPDATRASAADVMGRVLGELREVDEDLKHRIAALAKKEKSMKVSLQLNRAEIKLRTIRAVGRNIQKQYDRALDADAMAGLRQIIDGVRQVFEEVSGKPGSFDETYEVLGELGKGGMGRVLKARLRQTGETAVIKYLQDQYAEHPMLSARFKREAEVMAILNHPNIVRLIEHGENAGRYFIVMEFLEGGDLHQLFMGGTLTYVRVMQIFRQVLEGLACAHDHKIIHRDLKPANVFFTKDGIAKLADFGLATPPAGDDKLTRAGEMFGTPRYMPPEQALSAGEVDQTADLYSFGVMAYEILSRGKLPVGNWAPVSQISQGVQPAWDDIIAKCLQARPAMRWQSARELIAQIDSLNAQAVPATE